MISFSKGGIAGRIGNFAWCCGSDILPDDYRSSLLNGVSRFGSCFLLSPQAADIYSRWMGVIPR
jgi:hypothetical protein